MKNYGASSECSENPFEVAEMMLGPWNQQYNDILIAVSKDCEQEIKTSALFYPHKVHDAKSLKRIAKF